MVTFRNNNGRRNTFRRNDRGFKSSGERNKFNNNYSNTENFQRKAPGRNNHNASKLIDKSSELVKKNGYLFLEIGFDQTIKIKKILKNKGFYIKKVVKDLSNHDRCIISVKFK